MGKIILNLNYTSATPPRNLTSAQKAEYIARRNFYNLTATYNYFNYTLQGKKIQKNATAEDYFQKSTGLFNLDGAISEEKMEDLRKQLATTDSIIWHGVVSFDEATSSGFETEEAAINFMRKTFSTMFDATPLDLNNIELYASLHKDTDNRHIHFAFFEREPKHLDKYGRKGYTQKGNFNSAAFEHFLISSNMHLEKDKDLYYKARDEVMKELKHLRGAGEWEKTVKDLLQPLIEKIPRSGRVQYQSDNMKDLRADIDAVTEVFMRSNSDLFERHKKVLQEISRREKRAREICLENSFAEINGERVRVERSEIGADWTYLDKKTGARVKVTVDDAAWNKLLYVEKLHSDYYARLGNQIIGVVIDIRKPTKTERRPRKYNDRAYKAQRRERRQSTKSIIKNAIREIPQTNLREANAYYYKLKDIEWEKEHERK